MKSIKQLSIAFSLSIGLGIAVSAQPIALSANSNSMVSRQPDSRGWTDPALNHNKLLQQQNGEGAFKLVGPYKVQGSPYLFGPHHKADVFSATEKAWNIYVSYNTYTQGVEFYSTANPDQSLVKEAGSLDSFVIQVDSTQDIFAPLKFVYGPLLSSGDKAYYMEVEAGPRFTLYKKYKSELGVVSDNYIQSDLREYDLDYDYYYYDKQTKAIKKLKRNTSGLIKEFKSVTDLSTVVSADEFAVNQESVFRKAFDKLNTVQKGF